LSAEENPRQKPWLIPGNPGNSGGKKGRSGRPPGKIREACARAFSARVKILAQIAEGAILHYQEMPDGTKRELKEPVEISDRLKAMDLLGKYGGLQKIETEHVHKHYREAIEEVRAGLRLVG
jgi:hypothetical protein